MATDEEKIARFRAAFAADKTPRVTTHRGQFVFQYEPDGPAQAFPADVFDKMTENHERRSHRFDNGVTLAEIGGVDDPPPPPDP